MSNIHGLSFGDNKKAKDQEELTQMGSSNSATAVWRPQGPGGANNQVADIIAQAKSQQSSSSSSAAADRNIGLITLYSNGFMIGSNGEFRDRSQPQNARFLDELKKGEVPQELESICLKEWNIKPGTEVSVNLVDKSGETYEAPKPKFSFENSQGLTLGSSSSSALSNSLQAFSGATPARLTVDAAQPTTNLQIILSDRRKVKETFNQNVTVLQLYQHIMSLSGLNGFELVSGFPPKPLLQPDLTLKEAGLLGASVQQR